MKKSLLFSLLLLSCVCFSQNSSIKVKKSSSLCGTWECIVPVDSIRELHDLYVKITFQDNGNFLVSETTEGDQERGHWEMEKDSLHLIIDTDPDERFGIFHQKETYRITLNENEFNLDIPEIGHVIFRRKKE